MNQGSRPEDVVYLIFNIVIVIVLIVGIGVTAYTTPPRVEKQLLPSRSSFACGRCVGNKILWWGRMIPNRARCKACVAEQKKRKGALDAK